MKNKKGFTLIEIIICIGLIVLIGTSSIIGFKIISNKNLITKLEQISERTSEAAQVYIETNDTATNQLYNNKNGVSLPLQLLVNEGLLSLEGTELTEEDIKDQYVVTFLGGTGSSENCEQITSTNSWSNNQPIYLCLNSNGSSNLATIDPTKYGNKTTVSNEPYYFTGMYPDNYVTLSGNEGKISVIRYREGKLKDNSLDFAQIVSNARIYAIDRNDDILLAVNLSCDATLHDAGIYCPSGSYDRYSIKENKNEITSETINEEKLNKAGLSGVGTVWLGKISNGSNEVVPTYYYIFRLPSSCKITGGTGMSANPFEITC